MKKEFKILLILVLIMLGIKLFDVFFSPNHIFPGRTAIFSPFEIMLVSILGIAGIRLSEKIGLPGIWDKAASNKDRFVKPYIFGAGLGITFLLFDSFFRIGDINVGWPLSPIFYLWGAISQEIISHFFPITLFVFLVSNLIFKKKYNCQVYWIGAVLLSLVGALGMMLAFGNPEIPLNVRYGFVPFLVGLLVFGAELSILAMLKKYGFLSALFTRLGFYSVWHILWPLIFY